MSRINIGDALIIDNLHYMVTNLFDCDGDDTNESELAFSLVAACENGTWLAIAIQDVGSTLVH